VLDLVLKNGTVVDGTGLPRYVADVGIEGSRIAAVGKDLVGQQTLDCSGHVVAPGFIDCHSHSDIRVLAEPTLPMKLHQGITLEVLGQDGIAPAPVRAEERPAWKQSLLGLDGDFGVVWDWSSVGEYLARIEAARPAQDMAYLAPHGALRQCAMGGANKKPNPEELARMLALLEVAIAEGACGMSTGLIYPPCCYADTDELIELGRVLARTKRPLVVHMRSESDRVLESVDEMIHVAAESGCAVHISHIKIAGQSNWEKAAKMAARIDEARANGVRLTADQYPYVAGSTVLGAILPPWAHDGGIEATLRRLSVPSERARMRAQMADPGPSDWDNFWRWSGPEGILVADIPSGRRPEWLGQRLSDVAKAWGKDPFEAAFDLLLEERMGVAMVSFSQTEPVVGAFLSKPWAGVCTDGLLGGRPHPRAFGTYPRLLGVYVRERATLTLEEAVRKMTSQGAAAYGFVETGAIRPGSRANVVVFDAASVIDRATFEEPLQLSIGIRDVIVGGVLAVRDSKLTGARAGKVVK
jgi:N-acyl-D-amino-acid deacylase